MAVQRARGVVMCGGCASARVAMADEGGGGLRARADWRAGVAPTHQWQQPWHPVLLVAVAAGLVLQVAHQGVLMAHTRLYARTGYLLTLDLRGRLFTHLQSLSLRHHSRMPVGSA